MNDAFNPGGVVDLQLSAEQKKDIATQQRMSSLQMVLDMHSRGLPVVVKAYVGDASTNPNVDPKAALAAVYDAVRKWQQFIFDGQAIGS